MFYIISQEQIMELANNLHLLDMTLSRDKLLKEHIRKIINKLNEIKSQNGILIKHGQPLMINVLTAVYQILEKQRLETGHSDKEDEIERLGKGL